MNYRICKLILLYIDRKITDFSHFNRWLTLHHALMKEKNASFSWNRQVLMHFEIQPAVDFLGSTKALLPNSDPYAIVKTQSRQTKPARELKNMEHISINMGEIILSGIFFVTTAMSKAFLPSFFISTICHSPGAPSRQAERRLFI